MRWECGGRVFLFGKPPDGPQAPFKHCSAYCLHLFCSLQWHQGICSPYASSWLHPSGTTLQCTFYSEVRQHHLSLIFGLIYLQTFPSPYQTPVGISNREIWYIQPGCLPTTKVWSKFKGLMNTFSACFTEEPGDGHPLESFYKPIKKLCNNKSQACFPTCIPTFCMLPFKDTAIMICLVESTGESISSNLLTVLVTYLNKETIMNELYIFGLVRLLIIIFSENIGWKSKIQ